MAQFEADFQRSWNPFCDTFCAVQWRRRRRRGALLLERDPHMGQIPAQPQSVRDIGVAVQNESTPS